MPDQNAAKKFHDGAVIPDQWVPVVVGTPIGPNCIALRVGTGGGGTMTVSFAFDPTQTVTFTNVQDAELLDGRFYAVTAVSGVSAILAGIIT